MTLHSKARTFLYIVRHGECVGNVLKQNRFPEQSPLTDNGKIQAQLLGKLLREEKFTHAFTSDYLRASQTAEIILSKNDFSQYILLEKSAFLRERNLGVFEGADYGDIFLAIEKSGKSLIEWFPEDGESLADVEKRIENYLQTIFAAVDESSDQDAILNVSHSLFMVHLFKYLSQNPRTCVLENWNPNCTKACSNACYFKLAIQKNPSQNELRQIEILVAHGNEHLKALDTKSTFQNLTLNNDRYKHYKECVQQ